MTVVGGRVEGLSAVRGRVGGSTAVGGGKVIPPPSGVFPFSGDCAAMRAVLDKSKLIERRCFVLVFERRDTACQKKFRRNENPSTT